MKTVQVHDTTWKTLQTLKLNWNSPNINTVIQKLITNYEKTPEQGDKTP